MFTPYTLRTVSLSPRTFTKQLTNSPCLTHETIAYLWTFSHVLQKKYKVKDSSAGLDTSSSNNSHLSRDTLLQHFNLRTVKPRFIGRFAMLDY